MARELLFIGSDFAGLNFYNEDGTPMTEAPYVTLHNVEDGEYFVADVVQANEDGATYDAAFTAAVTSRMSPKLYNLEVFTDSTMTTMLRYIAEYAIGTIVSPTPGQVNNSSGV